VTPWYGPPNNTDRWQPIDAGYGKQVKDKAKEHYTTWWNLYVTHTHTHTHYSCLFSNKASFKTTTASDRRILITKWVGEAHRELSKDSAQIRNYFVKTGCLITTFGIHDENIIFYYYFKYYLIVNRNQTTRFSC